MERLTERFSNGQAAVYGCGNNCKHDFKYCETYNENCPTMVELYEKLAAYEDAEEQLLKAAGVDLQSMIGEFMHYYNLQKEGRLLELPCKLGDVIYYVEDGYIYKFIADRIEINNGIDDWDYCIGNMNFKKSDFGEIAFLSLEETESALAEMEE